MRWLVTTSEAYAPFLTHWFDAENHFNPDPALGMVVYDLSKMTYTTDGKTWKEIEEDRL